MKSLIKYLLAVFLLGSTSLFPQSSQKSQDDLLKRATDNFKLLNTDPENPEKAFQEAKKIEQEALKINAKKAELLAIENQFTYYQNNNDFEKMIMTAQLLYQKADSYKAYSYQIKAKRHLFEAYVFSGLTDRALYELEQGTDLIKKSNENDSLSIIAKLELLIAYSNHYLLKEDYKNQLKYLKLCGYEIEKILSNNDKNQLLSIYYLYLGGAYNNMNNLDSAKYYVELSQSKEKADKSNNKHAHRLLILGEIALKEGKYEDALSYYKEAENIEAYKNHLNISLLYDDIIQIYQKLEQKDSIKLYQEKKDSLKLSITENQNKSLHKLLNEKKDGTSSKYLFVLIFFLAVMIPLVFIVIRKNRRLAQNEKISQHYLKTLPENKTRLNYSELLEMLEEGDSAFMNYFDEAFPSFSKKLLETNPQIIQSEIEFCSLLKLKIPTKDIARYKYITPKTVQNKKYLIRKKLTIPKEVDIYQWFDSL